MTRHHASAHREEALRHAADLEAGVCLALDVLHELGEHAAADKAFAALFQPRDGARPSPTPPAAKQEPLLP